LDWQLAGLKGAIDDMLESEMEIRPDLDDNSATPIYRQLSAHLQRMIETGDVARGDRLPPTRELALRLGLNRTTVSAAYEVLEADGLIRGSVGRATGRVC
jgi:DNA-binding transcriptional regulator YhcF (GntR family)